MLNKGRYNPVYTGKSYVIEFPNHYHTGLLRCSFVTGKKRYLHTFILSFQNHEAETIKPTAKLFPTTVSTFQTSSTNLTTTATSSFGPTTLIPTTTFAPKTTKRYTILFHPPLLSSKCHPLCHPPLCLRDKASL